MILRMTIAANVMKAVLLVASVAACSSDAEAPVDERRGAATTDTCDPARASGVVGTYEQALHDTIAHAEGTRGRSKDGYDVMFSGITVTDCSSHPNQCNKFRKGCSTAAGRYQFLTERWSSLARVLALTTFEPENQERGAEYLVRTVRKATVPQDRALTAAEFSNVITILSYEWASLPPGRYGQPMKSMAELRTMYCGLAGC